MYMIETNAHRAAVDEVHALYLAACDHSQSNPDDREGIAQRVDQMLGRSMDLFMRDLDTVTPDTCRVILRRATNKNRHKAADDLPFYSCPVSAEELLSENPNMIPLLLFRMCSHLHTMNMDIRLVTSFERFVTNYGPRLPDSV